MALTAGALWLVWAVGPAAIAADSKTIDFNRDIRPILSDNCFACHGPDENKVKAGLRLDTKEEAFKELRSGGHALVPGDLGRSLLIERITADDESERMPPARTGKQLTQAQIDLLKRWVQEGAPWQQHWAFVKPQKHAPPPVKDTAWVRNAIDHFILNKLEAHNMKPSPEADKITLIRRVTLDLTGLPPTVAEVDAFLADNSPDAYEKVVDRLLKSPHYGERMAQDWLDLARYGDTNGYHYDSDRSMWPYRDYVIKAFNENKPFDQFTIENIAGDLLENPTVEQKIASGFNRNCTYNEEGGADPDEFMVKYAVDRAATTGTVYLGMTLGCAECHDHKYDPITQKEFYSFYAFFNSVEGELGAQGHDQPLPPLLKLPNEEQKKKMDELQTLLAAAQKELRERPARAAGAQAAWEERTRASFASSKLNQGLVAHYELDARDEKRIVDASGQYRHGIYRDGKPNWVAGKAGSALKFEGKSDVVDLGPIADFERTDAFSYGCWVNYQGGGGVMLAKMDEGQEHRGYDVGVVGGKIWVHLIHAWPANALKVTTKAPVPPNAWQHVMVTYDGSGKAAGLKVYLNGKVQEVEVNADSLTGSIRSKVPLYIGKRRASVPLHGMVDDVRIYDRLLTAAEVQQLATTAVIHSLLLVDADRRSPEENQQVQLHYLENHDPEYRKLKEQQASLQKQFDELDRSLPHTLVMTEMKERRAAFVLMRGDFQRPADKVEPDVPGIFPRLPKDKPNNRLGLAYWLTDPQHPLVSRVTVNRYWKHLFGTGLVKTAEDFGAQGEPPSHPELLDWLAIDFIENGWDIKRCIKQMVMSATYRQSSVVKDRHYDSDPYNRLLYRAPRLRLPAEQIRDNALAISGLINLTIGGPSVRPYQPPGYYGDKGRWKWVDSTGPDLYRRGIYTFWRRTTFYPSFQIFDAPSREQCTVDRPRTNTPLQALVTLNDPVYVEAARVFAQRIMTEGGDALERMLTFAFRSAVARPPTEKELGVLKQVYQRQYERYSTDLQAAVELVNNGQAERPRKLNVIELAAWTATANAILNLDETITRE